MSYGYGYGRLASPSFYGGADEEAWQSTYNGYGVAPLSLRLSRIQRERIRLLRRRISRLKGWRKQALANNKMGRVSSLGRQIARLQLRLKALAQAERKKSYSGYGFYGTFSAGTSKPLLSISTRTSQREATRELQNLLKARGFLDFTGTPDGDYFTNVQGAVMRFQAAVGLTVTGTSTPETWDKLRGVQPEAAEPTRSDIWAGAFDALNTALGFQAEEPTASDAGSTDLTAGGSGGSGGSGGEYLDVREDKKFNWAWVAVPVGLLSVGGLVWFLRKRKK